MDAEQTEKQTTVTLPYIIEPIKRILQEQLRVTVRFRPDSTLRVRRSIRTLVKLQREGTSESGQDWRYYRINHGWACMEVRTPHRLGVRRYSRQTSSIGNKDICWSHGTSTKNWKSWTENVGSYLKSNALCSRTKLELLFCTHVQFIL